MPGAGSGLRYSFATVVTGGSSVGAITHWLVAVAVTLSIGGLLTVFIWHVLRRRDETAAGIRSLAGTSWREFINLVLSALSRRGYTRVVDSETASGDGDFTLEHDGRHWLLSCKHASAYVLGKPDVEHLANDIRLANAAGGFLVTQGRILDEAREPAARRGIELLDGQALWPQLRELHKADELASIRESTTTLARQRTLLSWLLALLAGVATFMLLPEPAAQARPSIPASAPAPSIADEAEQAPEPVETALTPEQQREAVASAVSTLPLVTHALWSTHSTLEVHLAETGQDAMPGICPLVERYPALAASRIQLTAPPGSGEQVRFRQCRAY